MSLEEREELITELQDSFKLLTYEEADEETDIVLTAANIALEMAGITAAKVIRRRFPCDERTE